jgi:hypothetical protein
LERGSAVPLFRSICDRASNAQRPYPRSLKPHATTAPETLARNDMGCFTSLAAASAGTCRTAAFRQFHVDCRASFATVSAVNLRGFQLNGGLREYFYCPLFLRWRLP